MAKGKPMAALLPICFLFLLALACAAEIIDNNGVIGEDLNNGDDIDNHHKGNNDGKGNLKPSQCGGECRRRCSKTHHKKPCLFFCNKCCAKCLCRSACLQEPTATRKPAPATTTGRPRKEGPSALDDHDLPVFFLCCLARPQPRRNNFFV
ncbi:hypothetical protein PVAP13_3KG001000 [Panicum virgatum]|uniref:Uncharacterized protein n=1 Tax=Panicum virgatum TaxID=38727 RepID=A0A8T0UPL7_PANVG|nr:hypothetical protein PVAP13_3KG001000 [Panicum virgatum]